MELYDIFRECGSVATDSRAIKGGEIFFALKGENFDGNAYALAALSAGAAYAVVDEGTDAAESGNPRVIAVPDTLQALQELAHKHRQTVGKTNPETGEKTSPFIIGLTGTNGKTTTKELIRTVLSVKHKVIATEGNLNNAIGVPLSLLRIKDDTDVAVIEMGANHPEDIKDLVWMVDPDYALITNVGKAHLLGFGSFDGVKKAKGALYDYCKENGSWVFLNGDSSDLCSMIDERDLWDSVLPYGAETWGVEVLPSDSEHPYLRMAVPENPFDEDEESTLLGLETCLVGSYNADNVLAAIAVGLEFGVPVSDSVDAIASYIPENKRSQMVRTETNTVILDAYNANPTSMAAALDNFANIAGDNKAALLGSMGELGADSLNEHVTLLKRLRAVPLVCVVGDEFRKALEVSGNMDNVHWFASSSELCEWLGENRITDATVLVKGSRSTKMENVVPAL